MNPKSLLAIYVLLLVPVVHGCVIFEAYGGENTALWSQVWDDGTLTCMCDGNQGSDGLFHYKCIEGNYAAAFDEDSFVALYTSPAGSFSFPTTFDSGWWTACNYGCTSEQCFLDGYFG